MSSYKGNKATASEENNAKQLNLGYEIDKLLTGLDSKRRLMLLPVRLETHFRRSETGDKKHPKELCVRIYPDEIHMDYLTEALTEEEIMDAKRFWLQWFIASGSEKREYEAWEVLCSKYSVPRAAWIVRKLRPIDLDFFTEGGTLSYRRPFQHLGSIEESCNAIIKALEGIILADKDVKTYWGEWRSEQSIRTKLTEVKTHLFNIDEKIMFCEAVVDYLYDSIYATISYLQSRLRSILRFYKKHKAEYVGNLQLMELWDVDYTIATTLKKDVDIFLKKFAPKRRSMDEMMNEYLERYDTQKEGKLKFFPDIAEIRNNDTPQFPTADFLPDYFIFIGELANQEKTIIYRVGSKVNKNLNTTPVPSNVLDDKPWVDEDGNLHFGEGAKWMTDYATAEKYGMAITVPLAEKENAFNFIYVLGLQRNGNDSKTIDQLFQNHIYSDNGMRFIHTATPTNNVAGVQAEVEDEDKTKRERYMAEVVDFFKYKGTNTDGRIMADQLGDSGLWFETISRCPSKDNFEISNTAAVFDALWDFYSKRMLSETDDPEASSTCEFFRKVLPYVRPAGSFPSFMIGNQPYSILPVVDYLQLGLESQNNENGLKKLYTILMKLGDLWKELRDKHVMDSTRLKGSEAEKKYLEMTGLTARSIDFFKRDVLTGEFIATIDGKNSYNLHQKDVAIEEALERMDLIDYIKSLNFNDLNAYAEIKKRLPDISDEELRVIAGGFFDIFSYRLDAWYSALALYISTSDIKPVERPVIGAYGWVFNLKENTRKEIEANEKAKIIEKMHLGSDTKVYRNSGHDNGEYILAPSLQHAVSAAILRGAYLNSKKTITDSHMAVNLSSMRARQALKMIEGLRCGISLAEVLGQDLERYLHEAYKDTELAAEMDKFIYPLRKLFPLVCSIYSANEDERVNDYVMQTINGEALLNSFLNKCAGSDSVSDWLEANKNSLEWYAFLQEALHPTDIQRANLFKCIERTADSYDALSDVLLAESVYRLTLGDRETFNAINKFMIEGAGSLPDPSILKTPMERVTVGMKAGLTMKNQAPGKKPMTAAEPSLNAWIKQNLPLDKIYFWVGEETSTMNADGMQERIICYSRCYLSEVGIEPIELLYCYKHKQSFKNLIEYHWRKLNNNLTSHITILHTLPDNIGMNDVLEVDNTDFSQGLNLYEAELPLENLMKLVAESPALSALDYNPLIENNEEYYDKEELKNRYEAVKKIADKLVADISHTLYSLEGKAILKDEEIIHIYEILAGCAECGLINYIPQYNPDILTDGINIITDRSSLEERLELQQDLVERLKLTKEELDKKIRESDKLFGNTENAEQAELPHTCYINAIKALLLDTFKVCPAIRIDKVFEEQNTLHRQLHNGISTYKNVTPEIFMQWEEEVSAVEKGMGLWHNLMMFSDAMDKEMEGITPGILQHNRNGAYYGSASGPYGNGAEWLGVKVSSESELDDVDSIVLYGCDINGMEGSRSGLLLSSWLEYIPYRKSTAGIAIHVDKPDNEAPQTILLVGHPLYKSAQKNDNKGSKATSGREHWTIKDIINVLDTTRFLMMNRGVEPEHVLQHERLQEFFPILKNGPIDWKAVKADWETLTASEDELAAKRKEEIKDTYRFEVYARIFDNMSGGNNLL